jgi:pyruvate,water dikinase
MWSLYDFIWEDALKGFLREIKLFDIDFQAGRMFFGRPCWNLGAVKRCLMKLPGFVEREFDNDLSVQINYDGDGIRTPFTLGERRASVADDSRNRICVETPGALRSAFLAAGFDALVKPFEETPAKPGLPRRADSIRVSNHRIELFPNDLCASLAKLDFKDSFPDADYPALVGSLPPMRHLEPGGEMRAIGVAWRYRCHAAAGSIPAPQPPRTGYPGAALGRRPGVGGAAAGARRRPTDWTRDSYAKRLASHKIARVPWHKRRAFVRKLDRLRRFIWLREEMRDLSSRMYYLIRRRVLQIAERRGLGDDIFFMTFREILNDDRSTKIGRPRQIYESYRNFDAPHEIGSRFTFAEPAAAGALTGIPASPVPSAASPAWPMRWKRRWVSKKARSSSACSPIRGGPCCSIVRLAS